jgi:hypothetical protein
MGYEKPMTGAQRVARRRAALRAQGLRPRTFWLPDVRTDEFKERARRDVARSWELVDHDAEAMAFIEAITDDLLSDSSG